MKLSRRPGYRDWLPPCMAAMASSGHSASWPGESPSSRLSALRVSPRRMRKATSVFLRLDHHRPMPRRLADPQGTR